MRPTPLRLALLLLAVLAATGTTVHAFLASHHPHARASSPSATAIASTRSTSSSSIDKVGEMERILATHLYPDRDAAARKSLAFKHQDEWLQQQQRQQRQEAAAALTKGHLTYGEFPLASVAAVLDRLQLTSEDVFVDIGSGSGRIVLGISLLYPHLKACVGIEMLPELHAVAVEAHHRAQHDADFLALGLPRSPCRFVCADIESPAAAAAAAGAGDDRDPRRGGDWPTDPLAEATAVFMYCTTWRSEDALNLATPLRDALLRRLTSSSSTNTRGGVVVVTTDKRFPEQGEGETPRFVVVDRLDVPNPEVWESTAHFHRVER